ncbi:hypothetical protein [Pengzhenrongella sp.]|jgi:hypothetical protein|uniref:hypothetical protein n=1 Tax=Pengzhenrongella sp. TaxID=2888820 RepID=UPI002F943194
MTRRTGVAQHAARPARFGRDDAIAVAVAVIASLVGWLRLSDVTRATVWAEDGQVFLKGAFYAPPFDTLLRPYDGYLHLVPRFIVELVTMVVPPGGYALALTAISCAVAGGVAALVYVCSSAVTDSVALRLAFASVTVLVPSLPHEVLGNVANLHWFFLWLTPWLLIYRPRSRAGSYLLAAVALVGALTEIEMLFFVPLMGWRVRDRRGWPVRIALLAGLAAQAVALHVSTRSPAAGGALSVDSAVKGYLVNAVMTLWVGSGSAISSVIASFGWGLPLLVALLSLAVLVVVLIRGTGAQRIAAVAFAAGSLIIWTVAYEVNRPPLGSVDAAAPGVIEFTILRYAPVPSMLLLAGLLLGLTTVAWRRRLPRVIVAVLAVPLVVVMILNLAPGETVRSGGPVWAREIATGRTACLADPGLGNEILAIAPGKPWGAVIPCDLLSPSTTHP